MRQRINDYMKNLAKENMLGFFALEFTVFMGGLQGVFAFLKGVEKIWK